jgi:hypothetical protein
MDTLQAVIDDDEDEDENVPLTILLGGFIDEEP